MAADRAPRALAGGGRRHPATPCRDRGVGAGARGRASVRSSSGGRRNAAATRTRSTSRTPPGPTPGSKDANWPTSRELDALDLAALVDVAAGRTPGFGFERRPTPSCSSARTADRTRAAPATAVPSPARSPTPTGRRCGRPRTSAATGTRRTSSPCPTAPTTAGRTRAPPSPVADAALRGEVYLPHYRGRAGLPEAAQSAEWYARQRVRGPGRRRRRAPRRPPAGRAHDRRRPARRRASDDRDRPAARRRPAPARPPAARARPARRTYQALVALAVDSAA